MTGEEIAHRAWDICERFGKCNKFAGTVTTEIVKDALASEGISASVRDVFIEGLPIEWDLLIPRMSAAPTLNGLLYKPADVACALEIKLSGLHSQDDVPRMAKNFERAKAAGIACAYVTVGERESYPHRATAENLGFPAFTLMWHHPTPVDTLEWEKMLAFLKSCLAQI
jgi:hypothetical protein